MSLYLLLHLLFRCPLLLNASTRIHELSAERRSASFGVKSEEPLYGLKTEVTHPTTEGQEMPDWKRRLYNLGREDSPQKRQRTEESSRSPSPSESSYRQSGDSDRVRVSAFPCLENFGSDCSENPTKFRQAFPS